MATPLPGASSNGGGAPVGTTLINGRYRPTKRLGSGSFGEIFMGVGSKDEKVAIKFEKTGLRCPQLRHEYKVYRELANCTGIGRVHHYGTYGSSNVMVMDLLGSSLEDLFTKCGRRFSLKTTLKLADQLLERVDTVHSRHLIHRDIKPANFVVGDDTSDTVFCIDFGLSKRYRNPHTLAHIPHRVGKSLTGTPRYASINNHLGIEQARRDDLEAIGYVLIYFLKGRLPWQGLKARNASRKYKMIMEKKQSTSISTLCAGCPTVFAEYLSYCRSLKFEASPNVKYLRQLFRDLYTSQGYPLSTFNDNDWDWNRIEHPKHNPTAAESDRIGEASAGAGGGMASRISGAMNTSMGAPSRGAPTTAAGTRMQTAEPRPSVNTADPSATASGGAPRSGAAEEEGDARRGASTRGLTTGADAAAGGGAASGTGGGGSAANTGRNNGLPGDGGRGRGSSGHRGRPETGGGVGSDSMSGNGGMPSSSAAGGTAAAGNLSTGQTRHGWSDSMRAAGSGGGGAVVRRPSSAHGARSSPKMAMGTRGSGGGDGYVVAGAKSMMTYRRSRESAASGSQEVDGVDSNPAWSRSQHPVTRPKSAGMAGARGPAGGKSAGSSGRAGSATAQRSPSAGANRAPYYMTQSTVRTNAPSGKNLYSRSSKSGGPTNPPAGTQSSKQKSVRSPWSARVLHTHTSSVG